ncbi:hypothetical protein, partial [Streptomyces sp. SBT349]|uniref:hypothetical protein n=1 Tax=Streptomyces sp. SBT349 TaxID=1580539 RepID=UPI00066B120D
DSGPGWDYAACRGCLVAERLIPFALHPIGARGARMTYPRVVPEDLIARLAALGERPDLVALVARLLDATRRAAHEQARAAVTALRDAADGGAEQP